MWNFFAKESFQYEIGEKDDNFSGCSVFSLHKGVRKSTGETVSIFTYNIKGGKNNLLENARTAVKKLKTLKHPSILNYIDSYEDDNAIHLVTSQVVPLLTYLKKVQNDGKEDTYIRWGLMTIVEAVTFLNEHSFRHNNIFHGAVFVDETGSWKLGEMGYVSNENATYPSKVLEGLNKYNVPNPSESWSVDIWGLGVLIWEVFNGELINSSSLIKPKKIPAELSPVFQELISKQNKHNAVSLLPRLSQCCIQSNQLVAVLDVLHNYHLKDRDIKAKACKDLINLMPILPKDVILNKIVKLLKQAYEFDSDNSSFLVPVVAKIPALVTEDEFQKSVENFIITLFSSNDRATRLALLMNIDEILNKINNKSINDLFPYVTTGFLDSNPKIRGETVKAFVHFAPKLSKKHLNDEALRHLLQIQTKDSEPYIRTNTTICLGKIAHCLQPDSRKKMLLTAFLHALRDPFPAVRNAGAQAFAVTHRFFPLDIIAKNILPGLVCLTVDPELSVRQNSFKTIKMLFSKLEKFSESPDLKDELEKDVLNQACESNSSWSGWAFAAITAKFLKPGESKTQSPNSECLNKVTPDKGVLEKKSNDNNGSEENQHYGIINDQENSMKPTHEQDNDADDQDDNSDWEDDGWGEAHEEVLTTSETVVAVQKKNNSKKNIAGPMKLGTRLNKC